jgi:diguanylate cyclase (GGDEF)-like protein
LRFSERIGFGLATFPVDPQFDQLASGILFIGAAYCYGSALMIHFGTDRLTMIRRCLAAFFLVPHLYNVFVDPNLKLVLFNIEMVFAGLRAIAVFMVLGRNRNSADRVLVVASALATVDRLILGIVFTFVYLTSEETSDFVETAYNLSVYVTTLTIYLLFPFSAISALALRTVDRHRQAAARDPMTGLLNRRGFEAAVGELAKSGRTSGSIVIVDIDHFMAINDSLGHDAGDQVIVDMAVRLQDRAEQNMVLARFGAEEFVILLTQASEAQAVRWAEIMRQSLKDASVTRLHRRRSQQASG